MGGGEASAAAQLATGGRSRQHDRRCFGRLEQEDQRLKKHYGRWMDIAGGSELSAAGIFFHFKIFNYINFYAWRICWILY